MSSILRVCSETDDLGGGRFRHVQHMRPVAYLRDGAMRRMGFALAASGDLDMPIGVDEGMLVKFNPRIAGKSRMPFSVPQGTLAHRKASTIITSGFACAKFTNGVGSCLKSS